MTIDKRGRWWKGSGFADISEYLQALQPGGYTIDRVIEARCVCGSTLFYLNVDQNNELAQTVCASCGIVTFVADSDEFWAEAEPSPIDCPCRHKVFQIGLGLCERDNEWVRWGSLGIRCMRCGILSSPLDWKSDLALTNPKSTRVSAGGEVGTA